MVFRLFALTCLGVGLTACSGVRRFPLTPPLTRDPDQAPIAHAPEEYVSPFAWDAANQTVFRPVSRFFAADPAGRAIDVNALDEVPDSSWFTARLGVRSMTADEVRQGNCSDKPLDPNLPDGSWIVDKGKDNGANPGFRVNVPGIGKFMLKSDTATEPDRATGATAIATRVYHAVGYNAPCDSVVYFRPSLLRLEPGLTITNNEGHTYAFDQPHLNAVLAAASHRDGLVRMVASEWLPGKPLGPYRYDGRRDDDPNDVIPHEDRRELRGARLLAAWLAHFDTREQNTMDVFMPAGRHGEGYVRHYIIDLGDCFGSEWAVDGVSRRLNHAYMLDVPYMAEDFVTLGTIVRPWDRARKETPIFNYFSARDFDPELWRGEYPNPAFGRMTEADGAWMARILAGFDDELVRAVVDVGKFDPASELFLTRTLIARRDRILKRYLSRLSPLSDIHTNRSGFCATDLARKAGVLESSARFVAKSYQGADLAPCVVPSLVREGPARVCVELAHLVLPRELPDDDAERYRVVELYNGQAPGPLRAHLYDLGEHGYRLVGLERR
jgi:hypothetical protein